MIAFPGSDSYRVTGMPSRANTPARKSAALRVSPGGFEVSRRTYSWRSRVASSGACAPIQRCVNTKDTKDTKNRKKYEVRSTKEAVLRTSDFVLSDSPAQVLSGSSLCVLCILCVDRSFI